jgi:DNA-binding MurR/RpiR family transcriptional regulator
MTAGHGQKRSRQEEAALAALLSVPTIAEAATLAGISESTLLRWLQEPTFQQRYRAARREVVEHAISGLQQATGEAVEALRRNLTCGVPSSEIAAARAIIDQAVKGVELVDLAERIEQLERAARLEQPERTR